MDRHDPDELKQWRKALRSELLALRVAIPDEDRRRWTLAVTRYLLEGFPLLRGMAVGFYLPMCGEPDPRLAIRQLRKHGSTAALPVVIRKAAPLLFREWRPDVRMRTGAYNLREPELSAVLAPQALLIPPVGFDACGYRLGYGGGFFDRTLAAMQPQPLKIGLAFERSRIETIRPQPHDVPMDFILTEAGIHHAGPRGLEKLENLRQAAGLSDSIVEARKREWISGNLRAMRDATREYASPVCYAHDLDPYYWD